MNSKREIIVTGMHRSGTSVVANIIQSYGIFIGSQNELIPASLDNPKGFFENIHIVSINDAILNNFKSTYDAPNINHILNKGFTQIPDEINHRIYNKVNEFRGYNNTFMLKDPRFCITFPFWRAAFKNPLVVVCLRSPVEIAKSLQKRNGFSLFKGIGLWEIYILFLGNALKNTDFIFVDFNDLYNYPETTSKNLFNQLQEFGVCNIKYDESLIKKIFEHNLKREKSIKEELNIILSQKQLSLWNTITRERKIPTFFTSDQIHIDYINEFIKQRNTNIGYGSKKNTIQLFWKTEADEFSEEKSMSIQIIENKHDYIFKLPQQKIDNIRIDPINDSGVFYFIHIYIRSDKKSKSEIHNFTHNGFVDEKNGYYYFFTKDPNIYFNIDQETASNNLEILLSLKYNHLYLEEDGCKNNINLLYLRYINHKEKFLRSKVELDSTKTELDSTKTELDSTKTELDSTCGQLQSLRDSNAAIQHKLNRQKILNLKSLSDSAKNCSWHNSYQLAYSSKGAVSWPTHHYNIFFRRKNSKIKKVYNILDRVDRNNRIQFHKLTQIINEIPIFDYDFYRESDASLDASNLSLLRHYFFHGAQEGRNPSPYFFTSWYLSEYPDVANSGINPLLHFLLYGIQEGRNPSPYFFTSWYLKRYPHVQKQGTHPLLHYIQQGVIEGAWPNPYFDPAWYRNTYITNDQAEAEPLAHFLHESPGAHYNPNPYFDGAWYLRAYPWVKKMDMHPLQHYINFGIQEKTNPNPYFDSQWYAEHYPESLVDDLPPLAHYLSHKKDNLNPNPYFDATWYITSYPDVLENGIDPFLHYLLYGAKELRDPGPHFSTSWYVEKYPDVKESGVNPLLHFLEYGIYECRNPNPDFDTDLYLTKYPEVLESGIPPFLHYIQGGKNRKDTDGLSKCQNIPIPGVSELFTDDDLQRLDPARETILIVSHEASRTGAPILALNIASILANKYNVVMLSLRGGGILDDFKKACQLVLNPSAATASFQPQQLTALIEPILPLFNFKFAIVNSIVSRSILPALTKNFIPSVSLIHEFASYTHPQNAIREVLFYTNRIVFSANLVYIDNIQVCDELRNSKSIILPQGKCELFDHTKEEQKIANKEDIQKKLRPSSLSDNTILILGAGAVQFRKGVDIFISCAAKVVSLQPSNPFRFVWVGSGFDPEKDKAYSGYLQDQVYRAGLSNYLYFFDETSSIDQVYYLSDILFLSSRLDPLPNVAIDAICKGLPIVCFDQTTGIADILKDNGLHQECVIPYLDTDQAAQHLTFLINHEDKREQISERLRAIGEELFDMHSYVETLDELANKCAHERDIEQEDYEAISIAGTLNVPFCCHPALSSEDSETVIRAFVRSWKSGVDRRKPFAGFHPGLYLQHHGVDRIGRNPFADFIRVGCPAGIWLTEVIEPTSVGSILQSQTLRIALHLHVFFEELFAEIYRRLDTQLIKLDLFISVPNSEVADKIARLTEGYSSGSVCIRTVPNRGRDIGPLITEFGPIILANYDIIGHVHTKKSSNVRDAKMGQRWYTFLLENLIGGHYPMASIILERLAKDKQLGLIFPDDPNIVGWAGNRQIAEYLAQEFDLDSVPAEHFNFPVGTMFWARTHAIHPLLARNFSWDEYPEEPLLYDGTMLHAIERLLPSITHHKGYRTAVTHVPSVSR